jgi:membrane-bound inhibitor of C-type lysozyme
MRYALPMIVIAGSLAMAPPANVQFYSTYACTDGTRFAMALFDDYASLNLDGKLIHVPQQAALKGQRYTTGSIRLSIDGASVKLTRKRQTTSCRVESRIG